MRSEKLYERLKQIALREYSDIVIDAEHLENRLRVYFVDGSFLDVWFSRRIENKYAYHWERRHINGTVYRWDNAAHSKWKNIETFPHHFHKGAADNVEPFQPSESEEGTFRNILDFARKRLKPSEKLKM
ncbi:MAG: toxin-antitoxin system TumE family protein [Candidatus Baldrarchaeia archaeon]